MIKWLILCTLSLPAWGYRLTSDFSNGFYWATLPVSFTIVESDPTRASLMQSLVSSAMSEWEGRTGRSIWDLTGSGTNNIIRWSNNFSQETGMDPNSILAVAIRYTNGPYFAKSEIVINGTHPSFNTGFTSINRMNLGTTLVHELGHTMGLDHSENMMAVMAPTLQYPYNGLHNDDIDGMTDAYEQTENRQITKYISPLAYSKEQTSGSPLSCGTTGPATAVASQNHMASLGIGLLIGLLRKLVKWFKSLF